MEPWLEALIARGRVTGLLTYDEVNAAAPAMLEPEQLSAVIERFEAAGITIIDGDEPDDLSPAPGPPAPLLAGETEGLLEDADILGGHYHRNAEFDKLLRDHGIPFSDAACSFESSGRVFDAELIIPGERALAAWLALRNLVPVTGLWPVIRDAIPGPSLTTSPEQLDPGGRWQARREERRQNPELPLWVELTPEMIRADAAANIAEAEKVSPTPWTFRLFDGRSRIPEPPSSPDDIREAPEPNFAHLFSNEGPFRATREAAGGNDWPFYPFVRLRLYPTPVPWEVFAYIWGGGWNDCPHPDEQLTMIRHWHSCCGVEVVSHLGDWYELFVPHPPQSRHQAERLVREMGNFGEETFFSHGPWTHPDPVEAVRASHYWYFWWD